jgi:hypothetical protein
VNFLGYIIPAIREIRAPLVGGYLWLLAAWLNFGDWVPESVDTSGDSPWRQLTRLDSALGATGLLVAVSVAAVLIGSLVGELITVVTARWEQPDALGSIGASVPEAEYVADRATATYWEGEFRLHVALPLALVGLSLLLRGEVGIGGAVLVFAGAFGWHGFRLLNRWKRQAEAVRTLVAKRQEALSGAELSGRRAELRVTTSSPDPNGVARLLVQNRGPAMARDVYIVDPDSEVGAPPAFILKGFLPVEEIEPGDEVAIPVALTLADPPVSQILLRWIDSTGENERELTLRFS